MSCSVCYLGVSVGLVTFKTRVLYINANIVITNHTLNRLGSWKTLECCWYI